VTKKDLTEQEIRTRYITPALREAGWPLNQIREEHYLTDGQILPRGRTALGSKRSPGTTLALRHGTAWVAHSPSFNWTVIWMRFVDWQETEIRPV
jgi:hypothetical protein